MSKLCNALSGVYIGKGAMIMTATTTRDRDTLVLALASLVEAAEIGSFLYMSHHPRWPRQVQSCDCYVWLSLTVTLTNVKAEFRGFC